MESFRFIHAARGMVDHPLHGTGAAPEAMREIAEEATVTAFERVIDACLEHEVDFLLLAGDCFDKNDRTLRGPAAIVNGLERLADEGIAAIIAPGICDPWEAWPEGLKFPATAHRLGWNGAHAVPIVRDGKLLATIHDDEVTSASRSPGGQWFLKLPSQADETFAIRMEAVATGKGGPSEEATGGGHSETVKTVHYHAFGGNSERHTVKTGESLAHDPGPTQGIRALETGPRGCSLVEVDASGAAEIIFLPTAPVRWEKVALEVTPEMGREHLLEAMRHGLSRIEYLPTDRAWLVAWHVSGTGPLMPSLGRAEFRAAVVREIDRDGGIRDVIVHTHALRVIGAEQHAETIPSDEWGANFDRRIAKRVAKPEASLADVMAGSNLAAGPWEVRMESLIAELDAGEIAHTARAVGLAWFSGGEELSS